MDYDESLEFQELLTHYKKSKRQGSLCYLDSDDYIDIAEYYIANDQLKQAYRAVEDGLTFHHDNIDLLSLKANTLIGLNRFDEAEEVVAKLDPDEDHDAYYFSAQLICARGHDYEKAEKLFRKWLKIETDECGMMGDTEEAATRKREAYMHVIMSISDLADEEAARKLLPAWVGKYLKSCSPSPGDEIDLDIARICNSNQLFQLEIELYNHILDSNPYLPQGWTYLASLEVLYGNIEGSLNAVDFALAIDPDDTQALLIKGQNNLVLGNFEEAEKSLRKYVNLSHDDYYNIALANCMMINGKREAAYQLLKEYRLPVVRHVKDRFMKGEMWAYIADIYRRGKYYSDAMRSVNNALRLFPDSVSYKMLKGTIYLDQDQIGKAVMCFFEAAAKEENPVSMLLSAASELIDRDYLMATIMFLKLAIREKNDPDHVKAYPYLARCYLVLRMPKPFFENLKQACKYTPQMVAEFWKDDLMGIAPEDYYQVLRTLYEGKFEDIQPF